eukprot:756786-Hanusia_phi.AAC.2
MSTARDLLHDDKRTSTFRSLHLRPALRLARGTDTGDCCLQGLCNDLDVPDHEILCERPEYQHGHQRNAQHQYQVSDHVSRHVLQEERCEGKVDVTVSCERSQGGGASCLQLEGQGPSQEALAEHGQEEDEDEEAEAGKVGLVEESPVFLHPVVLLRVEGLALCQADENQESDGEASEDDSHNHLPASHPPAQPARHVPHAVSDRADEPSAVVVAEDVKEDGEEVLPGDGVPEGGVREACALRLDAPEEEVQESLHRLRSVLPGHPGGDGVGGAGLRDAADVGRRDEEREADDEELEERGDAEAVEDDDREAAEQHGEQVPALLGEPPGGGGVVACSCVDGGDEGIEDPGHLEVDEEDDEVAEGEAGGGGCSCVHVARDNSEPSHRLVVADRSHEDLQRQHALVDRQPRARAGDEDAGDGRAVGGGHAGGEVIDDHAVHAEGPDAVGDLELCSRRLLVLLQRAIPPRDPQRVQAKPLQELDVR